MGGIIRYSLGACDEMRWVLRHGVLLEGLKMVGLMNNIEIVVESDCLSLCKLINETATIPIYLQGIIVDWRARLKQLAVQAIKFWPREINHVADQLTKHARTFFLRISHSWINLQIF